MKVPLSATADEMLEAIRGLFPQLTGDVQLLRCLAQQTSGTAASRRQLPSSNEASAKTISTVRATTRSTFTFDKLQLFAYEFIMAA